jgi:Ca-activated chloride channel homolog
VRLALAVALASALLAAPAAAQEPEGKPVVGGGSFNAAPLLEPGTYHDTVLPSEYLYYAVRLEAGQNIHVTATSDADPDVYFGLAVSFVEVRLLAPSRDRMRTDPDWDTTGTFSSSDNHPAELFGPTVSGEEDEATSGPWEGPGIYYISVYAAYSGSQSDPPRVEIPFHFELEVEGEAVATPTPEPTATPSPKATARQRQTSSDDDGPTPTVAAGAGVAGLLIGVIGGIVLRQRRR